MKKNLHFILLIFFIAACKHETKPDEIKKSTISIEGLSELSDLLSNRIFNCIRDEYFNKRDSSLSSIGKEKEAFAKQVFGLTYLIDSLSNTLTKGVLANSGAEKYQLDTMSYNYLISKCSKTYSRNLLLNPVLLENYLKLCDCQNQILKLRQQITKGQTGKGHIECSEVGERIISEDWGKSNDYWDVLYLIEKTRYILFREMLCSLTNLRFYGKEVRYTYETKYDADFSWANRSGK